MTYLPEENKWYSLEVGSKVKILEEMGVSLYLTYTPMSSDSVGPWYGSVSYAEAGESGDVEIKVTRRKDTLENLVSELFTEIKALVEAGDRHE